MGVAACKGKKEQNHSKLDIPQLQIQLDIPKFKQLFKRREMQGSKQEE